MLVHFIVAVIVLALVAAVVVIAQRRLKQSELESCEDGGAGSGKEVTAVVCAHASEEELPSYELAARC